MKKIILRRYDVSEAVFDDILTNMASRIRVVDDIEPYFKGYPDTRTIVYDNREYLIIREHLLAHFANFTDDDYQTIADWRQVIVRRRVLKRSYQSSIEGTRAYNFMHQKILKYYSEEEYAARLSEYAVDKDPDQIQFHFLYPSKEVVRLHSRCAKYDINGAHLDALREVLPKAEEFFLTLFEHRHQKPIFKDYANYFVGMLCRRGYRRTYNWIVQRTTRILKNAIVYTGGCLVYANTDGFIVSHPRHELPHSMKLGEYKLEYAGPVYTFQGSNYWCYQIDEEITGSLRYQARPMVDLRSGDVVEYDIRRLSEPNGVVRSDVSDIRRMKVDVYQES